MGATGSWPPRDGKNRHRAEGLQHWRLRDLPVVSTDRHDRVRTEPTARPVVADRAVAELGGPWDSSPEEVAELGGRLRSLVALVEGPHSRHRRDAGWVESWWGPPTLPVGPGRLAWPRARCAYGPFWAHWSELLVPRPVPRWEWARPAFPPRPRPRAPRAFWPWPAPRVPRRDECRAGLPCGECDRPGRPQSRPTDSLLRWPMPRLPRAIPCSLNRAPLRARVPGFSSAPKRSLTSVLAITSTALYSFTTCTGWRRWTNDFHISTSGPLRPCRRAFCACDNCNRV